MLVLRWRGGDWIPTPCRIDDRQQRVGILLRRMDGCTEIRRAGVETFQRVLLQAVLQELRWLVEGDAGDPPPGPGPGGPGAEVDDVMARIASFLSINMQYRLDLAHVVRRYGLSQATLCRRFRSRYGVSPMAYLQQRRLERALDLLAASDLDPAEIAKRVGVRSARYLGRMIKARTGHVLAHWRPRRIEA